MKAECIESLIDCNREIEFTYKGKRYSITYFEKDNQRYNPDLNHSAHHTTKTNHYLEQYKVHVVLEQFFQDNLSFAIYIVRHHFQVVTIAASPVFASPSQQMHFLKI